MKKNYQYDEDLKYIQAYESKNSKKSEYAFYYVMLFSCMGSHILYLLMFAANGIKEMAFTNMLSIIGYAIMVFMVRIAKQREILVYCTLAEIIVHAAIATVFVGWKSDFGMFLLMTIPIALMIPNKKKNIEFVFMFVSLILYAVLRAIFLDPEMVIYFSEGEKAGTAFYSINIIMGASVLIYLTVNYTAKNRYIESKLRAHNEELRITASTDPLTHLKNRRAMDEAFDEVCSSSLETGKPYVIALGDIDNFKRVNDTYGHDIGDIVLEKVAETIMDKLPERGYAARWGGEEFLFIIPESCLNDGAEYAEEIVRSVRTIDFSKDDSIFNVTMTFGVCEGLPDDDVDKIISRADSRLYKGKNNGKNHTEYTD